jgi:hypothetical protein
MRNALSRANVLKLVSAGGIAALSAYALRESVPWVDYEAQAARPRRALPLNASTPLKLLGMLRYATLAANGHNAQPWKFALRPNAVEIHPDYSRRLAAVDPTNRELWISLGCALENLLLAARAVGYAPAVAYPDPLDSIRITLTEDRPQTDTLLDAIPLRQCTRSEYDGKAIRASHLNQLQQMPLEHGIGIHTITSGAGLSTLADYVHQATLGQYADQPFRAELIHWLRFDKKEVLASFDGLFSSCAGSPAVPRWLGQLFVNGSKPQDFADADVKKLRSSAGAFVISSASEHKADWVRAGQVYQRLALTMTLLNLKSAFLNQPIEVSHLRPQLGNSLGLVAGNPQLLIRFGYANAMPRSLRRPVEQVLLPS